MPDSVIDASIVIPAYNAESFIRKAMESVLTISDIAIELIVMDDKSTDATRDIVADLAQADARVRLVALETNRGHPYARNVALTMVRGDWVCFLDADDWYAAGRLQTMIAAGLESGADIVADNQYWILPNAPRPWRSLFPVTGNGSRRLSLHEYLELDVPGSPINPGYLKPILRRSFLTRTGITFDSLDRANEDFAFLAQCLFESDSLVLCDAPTYFYLTREGSISNTVKPEDLQNMKKATERLIDKVPARHGSDVRQLLRRRGALIDKAIRHDRIMRKFKNWNPLGAVMAFARDPGIAPFSAASIRKGTDSRFRKLFSRLGSGTG